MNVQTVYTTEVKIGTRNHRGAFVQEVSYRLVEISPSGWARICVNDAICHYVDPDNLHKHALRKDLA